MLGIFWSKVLMAIVPCGTFTIATLNLVFNSQSDNVPRGTLPRVCNSQGLQIVGSQRRELIRMAKVITIRPSGNRQNRLAPSSLANWEFVGNVGVYKVYAGQHCLQRLGEYEYDKETMIESVFAIYEHLEGFCKRGSAQDCMIRVHSWDVSFVLGFDTEGNVYGITTVPKGAGAYPAKPWRTIVLDID